MNEQAEVLFPRDPDAVMTDCLCPMCRKIHQLKIHWIGRGMPRKYCWTCLALIDKEKYHPSIDHFATGRTISRKMPEREDTKIHNWRQDH